MVRKAARVQTVDGREVEVLTIRALEDMKSWLLRWFLGTGFAGVMAALGIAYSLGRTATKIDQAAEVGGDLRVHEQQYQMTKSRLDSLTLIIQERLPRIVR